MYGKIVCGVFSAVQHPYLMDDSVLLCRYHLSTAYVRAHFWWEMCCGLGRCIEMCVYHYNFTQKRIITLQIL